MSRFRRYVSAVMVATALSTLLAGNTVRAAGTAPAPAAAQTAFCGYLSKVILQVAALPQSPLRDLVLASLNRAFDRVCK